MVAVSVCMSTLRRFAFWLVIYIYSLTGIDQLLRCLGVQQTVLYCRLSLHPHPPLLDAAQVTTERNIFYIETFAPDLVWQPATAPFFEM
jgi:hypothetical protein